MRFHSIKFKISVLYTAILGTVLILYSSVLFFSLYYTLYRDLDGELKVKAREIHEMIHAYSVYLGQDQRSLFEAARKVIQFEDTYQTGERKLHELEQEWFFKGDKLNVRNDYLNFVNLDDGSYVCSRNVAGGLLSIFLKDIKRMRPPEILFRNITFHKSRIRTISFPFSGQIQGRYILQVGTSLRPITSILRNRLFFTATSISVILLLAVFSGQLFASRILKPVVEVTRTARNITHENLGARVEAEHVDEEMKYLVDAFNDMISRLEKAFTYTADCISHVAHELKTPLAIMRGESEIALRKERDPQEYKRVIKINLEETQRMLRYIDDLLLLTKLAYRPEAFKFGPIEAIEFLREIGEQIKILASQKEIEIHINLPQTEIFIHGDRLHLRRMFFNLIDNALKFTPKNGRINIAACREDGLMVSISDTGIGIAEEDLPRIFKKFFRGGRADRSNEPGIGLGLSIAKSIAEIHHGRIEVKSKENEGSTFTIVLPLSHS